MLINTHRRPLPRHTAGFGRAGAELLEAQRRGGRGKGFVPEEAPGAQAGAAQRRVVLAVEAHGLLVLPQALRLRSLPLHLRRHPGAEDGHHRLLRHPAPGQRGEKGERVRKGEKG